MKRIIFLTVTVVSLFTATTMKPQQTLHFEMQTAKAIGSEIAFRISVTGGTEPKNTVAIDWGDGTPETYTNVSTTTANQTEIIGTLVGSQTIKIYTVNGNRIAGFQCGYFYNNRAVNNELTLLDLSSSAGLLQLYINYNKISKLKGLEKHTNLQIFQSLESTNSFYYDDDFEGFTANKKLTQLRFSNMAITNAKKLNLSGCTQINEFYLHNDGPTNANSLDACALDSIYNWLPDRTGKATPALIIVGRSDYTGTPDNDYNGSNKDIINNRNINWNARLFTSNRVINGDGDGGGCKTDPTSIDKVNAPAVEKSFHVYPNPAKDIITIQASDEILNRKLLITDIAGRLIREDRVTNNQMTLDVGDLPKGIYLIHIDGAQKLIVE